MTPPPLSASPSSSATSDYMSAVTTVLGGAPAAPVASSRTSPALGAIAAPTTHRRDDSMQTMLGSTLTALRVPRASLEFTVEMHDSDTDDDDDDDEDDDEHDQSHDVHGSAGTGNLASPTLVSSPPLTPARRATPPTSPAGKRATMPAHTDPWPKGTLASHSSATIVSPATLAAPSAAPNYRLSQSTSLLTPPSTMPRTRHAGAGTGAHPAHAAMVARVARLVNVAQELYHESTMPPVAPPTTADAPTAKYAKWKQVATEKSAGVAVCVRKVKDPAAKRARSVRVPWFAGKKSHQTAATASTVSSESDAATVSVAQDLLTRPPVAVRARGEVPVGVGEVLRLLVRPEDWNPDIEAKYNLLHEGELPVTLSIFKKSHRRRHRVEVIHSIGNCVYLCTTALPPPPLTTPPAKDTKHDKHDDPSDLVTLAWVLTPALTDTTHTDVCLLAYGDADSAAHGAKPAVVLKECRKSAALVGVLAKYIRKNTAKLASTTDPAEPEPVVAARARPMTWAVPVEDDETTAGPPVHADDLVAFPLVHRLLMHHQADAAGSYPPAPAPGAVSAPTSPPRMKRAAAADVRTDAATPARILSIARNRNESLSSNRLLVRVTRSYSDSLIQYPVPPTAPTTAAHAQQQQQQSHDEEVPVGGEGDDDAARAHHEHQQAALKRLGTLDPRVVAIALATALMAVRYGLVGA
ncbi:hypothetical protein GGF31_006626 [Allomyces arbusculus]|nr:hypothetical protein GGF31_006626 [Allomyces arbusculus]